MYSVKQAANFYTDRGREASVAGATPHQLVKIMFDELESVLGALVHLNSPELRERRVAAANRAVTILYGLSSTLDFERGGRIAEDLQAIYDYAIRRIQAGISGTAGEGVFAEVAGLIGEIAGAWTEIRQ